VILRALQLGDLLCAVPAIRAMRAGWPGARITLIGLPWARVLVGRFGAYLDDFVEFPGHPELPERAADRAAWPAFLAALRARTPDLAIQLHGDGTITNALVARFGAATVAGFVPRGTPPPSAGVFVEYPDDCHEVQRLLALTRALALPERGEHLEFPLGDTDEREWAALKRALGLSPRQYVCLHPGARAAERRWPPSRFSRVGCALAARGLPVVITGHGELEERLAREIAAGTGGRAQSVAGRTSLGAMAALVRDARLVICNDTGLSHVAAAVGTPSVVIFRVTEPRRWAPLDAARHRPVIDGTGAEDAVLAAADVLLGREQPHAA
jgi:ADP-heptose:LPS heptosyltransferase